MVLKRRLKPLILYLIAPLKAFRKYEILFPTCCFFKNYTGSTMVCYLLTEVNTHLKDFCSTDAIIVAIRHTTYNFSSHLDLSFYVHFLLPTKFLLISYADHDLLRWMLRWLGEIFITYAIFIQKQQAVLIPQFCSKKI